MWIWLVRDGLSLHAALQSVFRYAIVPSEPKYVMVLKIKFAV